MPLEAWEQLRRARTDVVSRFMCACALIATMRSFACAALEL